MKHVKLPLLVGLLVAFTIAGAFAATEIVVDNITGGTAGNPVRFNCRMTFTPGNGSKIIGFSNGFRVWTTDNGYTDNFSPITYDTFSVGWFSLMDLGFFINPLGVDGMAEDTVGFSAAAIFQGIPDGFDNLSWWVETTPTTAGDTLCIDSTFYPPGGAWLWSTNFGSVIPAWGGPYCLEVGCPFPPGDLNCDESVNIADMTYMVDFLFRGGPAPLNCCP